MSNTLDTETNGEGGQPLDPHIREQLRKTNEWEKEAKEANARMAEMERKMAFTEAGIPASGVGQLFRDAYQGDLSAEAVRAAAESYGILEQSQSEQGGLSPEERAAQQRILGGTGAGGSSAGRDPRDEMLQRIRSATNAHEVMDLVREMENTHPELGRYTSET